MLEAFDKYLLKVVNEYQGPKLAFMVAGAGASLARLATIPGASRILHEVACPYDVEATKRYIKDSLGHVRYFSSKAVSADSAWEISRALVQRVPEGVIAVGVTGAATSTRYRRGNNEAFISVGQGPVNHNFHVKLVKPDESLYTSSTFTEEKRQELICRIRFEEDETIAAATLQVVTGFQPPESICEQVERL